MLVLPKGKPLKRSGGFGQFASVVIEDSRVDMGIETSAPRSSTASNAWPTNSRVGAKEVGRSPSALSREAVYPACGRDASITATHGMAAGRPVRNKEAAT